MLSQRWIKLHKILICIMLKTTTTINCVLFSLLNAMFAMGSIVVFMFYFRYFMARLFFRLFTVSGCFAPRSEEHIRRKEIWSFGFYFHSFQKFCYENACVYRMHLFQCEWKEWFFLLVLLNAFAWCVCVCVPFCQRTLMCSSQKVIR